MSFNFNIPINSRNTNSAKWDRYAKDILPMHVAVMDFAISPAITERIQNRLSHPVYGYTMPSKQLYDTLLQWVETEFHYKIFADWLVLLEGIVPALGVSATILPGDVITTTPNYHALLHAPLRAGKNVIQVPLKNDNEHYSFDFDALEEAITPNTKFFYLCNPHNPVGRMYTKEELLEVSAFAQKHDLIVVSDEIHCELAFDRVHIPFYTVDEYAKNHSITFTAIGKTYNMPGVNFAFAVIPNPDIKKLFQEKSYALSRPGIFNQEAAIGAYAYSLQWKHELLVYLRENRDYLENELKTKFPLAKFPHVEGTYLQWVNFNAYHPNANSSFFEKEARIAFTNGANFGDENYVRINFACTRKTLEEAVTRLEHVLLPNKLAV